MVADDETLPPNPDVLRVRVGLLEKRDIDIEKQVNAIRDTMATKGDIRELSQQIQTLVIAQQNATKTNYPLLGLLIAGIGMVGGFAYWPINTSIVDLKTEVALLSEGTPRVQRYNQDQDRLTHILDQINARQLRDEEKYLTSSDFDVQHQDLKDRIHGIDRRLEWVEHHASSK